jgi:predicted small secreted protein
MKKIAMTMLTMLLLTGAASALSACNTTAGAGKDLSAAGRAINNSAEENKTY